MYQEKVKIDWWVVAVWALLVLFGWANIYSSTYDGIHTNLLDFNTVHGKQLLWIGISVLLAGLLLLIEPRVFSNAAIPIYGVVVVLLALTLVIGEEHNGARSWINLGNFVLQPSEFAKFAVALALSKYMSNIEVEWRQTRTKIVALTLIAIPMGLILLQPDAGSVLVFIAFFFPLFREGMWGGILVIGLTAILLFVLALLVPYYYLIGGMVVLAVLYLFVWLNKRTARTYWRVAGILVACTLFIFSVDWVFDNVLDTHQRERIEVLIGTNKDIKKTGYNVHQSKIAIGSGGIAGRGYLDGTLTKASFVPEQHTDFIFCTVGEEWGFLGSVAVIGLFLWLILHLVTMAERQRSTFSRVYGYSAAGILFIHLLVNIGMVTGLLPVIGIPLPFFSYGGSSLIAFTLLLFIFIRLDATKNQLY